MGNVAFGLEVAGVGAKAARDIAREYVNLVGLNGSRSLSARTVRRKCQQRVGIARALAI